MIDNVLSWADDLDERTLEQAARVSRLPSVHSHVALMADAHLGLGATVGSVIATKGAVIPAAVGVDIGCGMVAVRTRFDAGDLPDDLSRLHSQIARAVPAGVGTGHANARVRPEMFDERVDLDNRLEKKAASQLGSLGSGNHFIEVCLDERDRVWVMVHSGSRGVGNELARRHIESARGVMGRHLADLEDRDLAHLVEGTPEFDEYINAMLWAQDYARSNRNVMMDLVLAELARFLGVPLDGVEVDRVDCHHNFCERERHDGQDVWVTRKGAIRARAGERGIIPGSMGTASYIVEGLGNPASYMSSSHGAGRRMSRKAARRELDVEGLMDAMAGTAWNRRAAAKLIDEDPRSYKDIDEVIAAQEDLVTVTHTLRQILNYKGL